MSVTQFDFYIGNVSEESVAASFAKRFNPAKTGYSSHFKQHVIDRGAKLAHDAAKPLMTRRKEQHYKRASDHVHGTSYRHGLAATHDYRREHFRKSRIAERLYKRDVHRVKSAPKKLVSGVTSVFKRGE